MNYAIILAGGSGSRAGGPLPKQFQKVGGKRLIWWCVEAFIAFDPECKIILVLPKVYLDSWENEFGDEERQMCKEILKVEGGNSRFHSVKNALSLVEETKGIVFIHDGARPLVTPELIKRGLDTVECGKGAVPAVPVVNSLRKLTTTGSVAVDRSQFVAVQTPQIFMAEDIKAAYLSAEDDIKFTDDASVAENFGLKISLFEGDSKNIKITHPEDFKRL